MTDFTCTLKKPATVEQINAAFKEAASKGALRNVLEYSEEPLVSSGHRRHDCILHVRLGAHDVDGNARQDRRLV